MNKQLIGKLWEDGGREERGERSQAQDAQVSPKKAQSWEEALDH